MCNCDVSSLVSLTVSKVAKIRNRYNQDSCLLKSKAHNKKKSLDTVFQILVAERPYKQKFWN